MNGVLNIPYYIDDAHGWAIVTMTDLRKARLHPNDFPNAYKRKIRAFGKVHELFALEEDCEMPILLNKLNDNGVIYQLTEKRVSFEDEDNPRNWQ